MAQVMKVQIVKEGIALQLPPQRESRRLQRRQINAHVQQALQFDLDGRKVHHAAAA